MSVSASLFPNGWQGELVPVSLTLYILSMCAAASLPWIAAHLGFWGVRSGKKSDLAIAYQLGRMALYGVAAVFFSGMLSFHLVSNRYPETLFSAAIVLAFFVGALPVLMAVYGMLLLPFRFRPEKVRNGLLPPLWTTVGAGVAAAASVVILAAWVLAASDKSFLPEIAQNPVPFLRAPFFLFSMSLAFLMSALIGGVSLMLAGRRSFYWERGESVSDGARFIRAGAVLALCAVIFLIALGALWVLMNGIGPVRSLITPEQPALPVLAALAAIGSVGLIEVLVSILKWRGSAPRASLVAAVLVFTVLFCVVSMWSLKEASRPELAVARSADAHEQARR